MVDLTKLSPPALKAAMTGGATEWGRWGSSAEHIKYVEAVDPKSRRRCHCGCKRRATHRGMANGVCLTMGCEMHMHRWTKK